MKKLFIGIAIMTVMLSACSELSTPKDSDAPITEESSQLIEPEPRLVEFEINKSIMETLPFDDEVIKLLDEIYLASSEAYAALDAHQYVSKVYDAVVVFHDRFMKEVDQIQNPASEAGQKFLSEIITKYSMELEPIWEAGLQYTEGNISAEKAAFEILLGVDSILSYLYQDYVDIYQPIHLSVDDIYTMYEENELAAEERFQNQLLCVSGTVYEVARDILGEAYVGLATERNLSYELLRCYVDPTQNEKISALKKGDTVTCVIQITDKDTFDVNAVVWDISLLSESNNADNSEDSIRESLRSNFPNDYHGAKNEFQRLYPGEVFLDNYYFTDYECQMIQDLENNYDAYIYRETYENGWVKVESASGEIGDEFVYIGETDPWE